MHGPGCRSGGRASLSLSRDGIPERKEGRPEPGRSLLGKAAKWNCNGDNALRLLLCETAPEETWRQRSEDPGAKRPRGHAPGVLHAPQATPLTWRPGPTSASCPARGEAPCRWLTVLVLPPSTTRARQPELREPR